MLPSQEIELAIYTRIKSLGPKAAPMNLAILGQATGEGDATVVERLKGLEAENHIMLSKYSGGQRWPRNNSEDTPFFYTGEFLIEVTPQGRKYFEELEQKAIQTPRIMKPFIFISCGQYFQHEKKLGLQIKDLIEAHTPFDGYFAEDQSSVNGLVANILERLYNCAGFVCVMHPRGIVTNDEDNSSVRASVWIEQEVAIIALIQQLVREDKNDLKIAAYAHKSIQLEGIRTLLQLNPITFDDDDSFVLADLKRKLPTWRPAEASAIKTMRWSRYEQEIQRLKETPEHIAALRILTLEGATNDRYAVRRLKEQGLAANRAQVLAGMSNSTMFVQPVVGQPEQMRNEERRFEIKPEAKEFLEEYFSKPRNQ